jgi:hypothetical protein
LILQGFKEEQSLQLDLAVSPTNIGDFMKKMVLAIALTFSQLSFGAEIKSASLETLTDIGVITSPKGCTQEAKGFLGIKTKKEVDCFGVVLRGVSGKNQLGVQVSLGDILLFPAGLDRAEAEKVVQSLIAKMNNQLPEGTTIELSSIRYIEKEFSLSAITKDQADTANVKLGGISIHSQVVQKNGNTTFTSTNNLNLGLQ